jgi:hypothetical protein
LGQNVREFGVPNPWWIAICAGLLSGSFSALATYTLNYNRESNDYRRKKAEDFYLAVEQYISLLKISIVHDLAPTKMPGLPLTDAQTLEMASSYTTIKMSAHIHFTILSQRVDTLFAARDAIAAELLKSGASKADRSKAVKEAIQRMDSCADDLKMHISRAARHGAPLSLLEAAGQLIGMNK